MKYLIPLVRSSRAITTILIFPKHPVEAIILSETVSFIQPFLDSNYFPKIISIIMALIFAPSYGLIFLDTLYKKNIIFYQAEICSILFFVPLYFLSNNNF